LQAAATVLHKPGIRCITDTEGNIKKVIIDFSDYLRLLEAIEDEGFILAMQEVHYETPLNLNEALLELEKE
jgi:hypothetical protein